MTDAAAAFRGISIGTHVRIERVSSGKAEGTLREKHADGVTIGNGSVLERIAFLDISSIWKKATFAMHGALIGAVAGLILGGLVTAKAFALIAAFLVGKVLVIFVLALALMCALFGAALGAWIPRWVKVWG